MWDELKQRVETAVLGRIRELYGEASEALVFEKPPNLDLGDLALPVCFELARTLKRAPRQIAAEIIEDLASIPGCRSVEPAGAGYINVFLHRGDFLRQLAAASTACAAASDPATSMDAGSTEAVPATRPVIVEHTNINPNKAAHIGHLRNAVLGDTLVRLLRSLGRRVEVENYIDNTGVQVADVVVGFRELEGMTSIAALKAIPEPFDYTCWDVYSRVRDYYEEQGEAGKILRGETLRLIEEGEGVVAAMAAYIAERNLRRHIETMERIGVKYDLLPWEGDILKLDFWQRAFEQLKEKKAAVFKEEGRYAGCWIMPLSQSPRFADMEDPDKVLVRSNGTVTYVAKDFAYQLWKFGLLGGDFFYQRFHQYPDGHWIWKTTAESGDAEPGSPSFGGADTVYNVIDVRQSYLQKVVAEGLEIFGHTAEAERSIHFAYEMVALSPACARDLGLPVSEEDAGKTQVEMSGRKGLGVKADDLIDRLEEKAAVEVGTRNPGLSDDERRDVARIIARGALRYFMLKYTRNKVIVFDLEEALSFEGEAGPYVQYAAVRSANILRKLDGFGQARVEAVAARFDFSVLPDEECRDTWEIVHLLSSLNEMTRSAIEALELSHVAHYAFTLAQKFNAYYHKYRILHEPDQTLKEMRALFVHLFHGQMVRTLDLLGISVPNRM